MRGTFARWDKRRRGPSIYVCSYEPRKFFDKTTLFVRAEFLLCVVFFFTLFVSFFAHCYSPFSSECVRRRIHRLLSFRSPRSGKNLRGEERFISDDTWKWSICISQAAERGSLSIAREVFSSIFKMLACYFIPRPYRKFAVDKLRFFLSK